MVAGPSDKKQTDQTKTRKTEAVDQELERVVQKMRRSAVTPVNMSMGKILNLNLLP